MKKIHHHIKHHAKRIKRKHVGILWLFLLVLIPVVLWFLRIPVPVVQKDTKTPPPLSITAAKAIDTHKSTFPREVRSGPRVVVEKSDLFGKPTSYTIDIPNQPYPPNPSNLPKKTSLVPLAFAQEVLSPLASAMLGDNLDKAHVSIPANYSQAFTITKGVFSLSFSPVANKQVTAEAADNTIIYSNSRPQTDVVLQAMLYGVKENIVLKDKTASKDFAWNLTASDNLELRTNSKGGYAFFEKGTYQMEASPSARQKASSSNKYSTDTTPFAVGKKIFELPSPYMVDAKGNRSTNVKVTVTPGRWPNGLLPGGTNSEVLSGELTLTLIPDEKFLKTAAYPVLIDPTVIHDTTSEFSAGQFNRTKDTGSGNFPELIDHYQELPADINTLALWHFNNALTDSSGNSLTLSAGGNAAATTTSILGGYAETFDGTGDYASIADNALLDFAAADNFTVEAWIKHNGAIATNPDYILTKADTTTSGYKLYMDASGDFCFDIDDDASWTPDDSACTSAVDYDDSNWHHVVGVKTGTTDIKLYVDGINVASDTSIAATGTLANTNTLYIGIDRDGSSNGWDGQIDEVRISNIARTPEEIKLDAQRRPYSVYTSDVIDINGITSFTNLNWMEYGVKTSDGETATNSASLTAQWNFNETSGTTADNAEGTAALDGTLTNYTESTSNDCLDSQDDVTPAGCADSHWTANDRRWGAGALTLDGSNDYVTVNDHANLNPSSAITVETWIKPAAWQASDTVIAKRNTSNVGGYLIQMGTSTNTIGFYVYSGGTWRGAYNGYFTPGEWTYVVGTYDGTTVKTYINGVLAGSTSYSGTINDDNGALRFGNYVLDGSQSYAGVIDSTRIYSRALPDYEILTMYNAGNIEFQTRTSADNSTWEAWMPTTSETQIDSLNGPSQYNTTDSGLVSYWPLDDGNMSGGTTADVKGTNTGTLYGTRSVDGKFGKARKFNGSSEYITTPQVLNSSTFTIEAWVYLNASNSTNGAPIYYQGTGSSDLGTAIGEYNGGAFFYVGGGGILQSGSTFPTKQWLHIVGVSNALSLTLYINGVQQYTGTGSGSPSANSGSFARWYDYTSSSRYLNGTIDEVRIYSTALSASTIQQKFLEGAKMAGLNNISATTSATIKYEGTASLKETLGAPKVDANTVGLWHMDESTGSAKFMVDTNSTLKSSLISYWGLNETATGTNYDSFYTKNGTQTSASVGVGIQGNGVSFNGTTSKIDFGADYFPTGGSAYPNFSISMWIKPTTVTANQILLVQSPTGTERAGDIALWLRSTNTIVMDRFDGTNNQADRGETATGALQANRWQHIVVTWSGGNNGTRNIYINGNQMSLTNTNDTATGDWNITNLTMGGGLASYWYNGTIDEAAVWSKALASQEITDLLNDHYADSTYQSATAYWKMDESSDGSAAVTRNDSVGSNNLTDNSPYAASAIGVRSNALQLVRVNSEYLSITDNANVSSGDIDFSIATWVRMDSKPASASFMYVLRKQSEYELLYNNDAGPVDRFQFGWGTTSVRANTFGSPSTATWYFLVAWHDATNNLICIQVNNGKADCAAEATVSDTANALDIGRHSASSHHWDGRIDELGLFKNILSSQQKDNLYQARANPYAMGGNYIKDARSGEFTTDNMGTLEQGLVGYWKLDEADTGGASAVTRYDSFGANNLTDTSKVASRSGVLGNSAQFNNPSCTGTGCQYLSIADNVDLSSGNVDLTVAAWVYLDSTNIPMYFVAKDDASNFEYALRFVNGSPGYFSFQIRNGNEGADCKNGGISTGQWYFLVGWRDATAATVYCQVNAGTPVSAASSPGPSDLNGAFYIGSANPTRGINAANGRIDEVGVWKRVLTAQERLDLYNSGNGQTYSGGGGFHGSALGINVLPAVSNGFLGKAGNFDGSNDYISIGSLRNAGSAVKSVEFWTYPTSTTDYFVDLNGSAYVWANAGTLTATGFTTPTYYVNGVSTQTIVANKWQHVAVTTASGLNASAVNIGKTTTNYMAGKIDEVKISDVARSADEIAEAYRAGRDHRITKTISSTDLSAQQKVPFYVASDRQGTFLEATIGEGAFQNNEPDTNTVGLWHLEEVAGSGAYIKDSSGKGADGTPTGTTFVQGKIGKARKFNGTSDLINIPDSTSLDITGNFTISAWINANTMGANNYLIAGKVDLPTANDEGYGLYVDGTNKRIFGWSSNATNYCQGFGATNELATGNWYHATLTYDGSNIRTYVNGVLTGVTACTQNPAANNVALRFANPPGGATYFDGNIDEVNIANTARTADQIRQSFEIGKRSHEITIDFKAALATSNLITSSSDLSFTVDGTVFGAQSKGDNLNIGDTIIVKEKVDETEYIAQGVVTAVTASTGAVTVASWTGTVPTGGFTQHAIAFKWQREYFDITGVPLSTQRDAITTLTLRVTDGSQGSNVYLDDFKYAGNYLTTPGGSTITSTVNRYFQYRAIVSTSDTAVAPSIKTVTLDYSTNTAPSAPTLSAPTNGAISQSFTPALQLRAPDAQSDYLRYKILLCTDSNLTQNCQTFTQPDGSPQTGWSGQDAQTNTAYASNPVVSSSTLATYTIQSALSVGTTYYWAGYAIDPGGTNAWSAASSTFSFTTNAPPNTPTLDSPANGSANQSLTPVLLTTATDNDTDYLRYKIEICTNAAMDTGCLTTIDQTVSQTGWSGQDSQSSTAYASATQAIYTLQSELAANTTYYWRSYAKDPGGSNTWSATQSTPNSFTTTALITTTSCSIDDGSKPGTAIVKWQDNSSIEDRFRIERNINGGAFSLLTNASANATSYTDNSTSANNTYQYRIRPETTGGDNGDWCTTPTIDYSQGNLRFEGLQMEGLKLN